MSKKKEYGVERVPEAAPEKLDNHIFFGLTLDEDQTSSETQYEIKM